MALVALTVTPATASPDWPPFLPARQSLSPAVASTVERVWTDPTLTRTVAGPAVAVPFELYTALVDAPEVTAAAARHRGLANYTVRALGRDWYEADDGKGARGVYTVVVRERGRRVIVSWGHHTSVFLGTVAGSALTVIDFAERGEEVTQRLTAYAVIDNTVAAALARMLVAIFGGLADRKLTEGFRVTANVAEWAAGRPGQFCVWLDRSIAPEQRDAIARALGGCTMPRVTLPRP